MLVDLLKRVLYESGALGLYHRFRNRDVLTVVMVHRVLSRADPRSASADPDYTISDDLFARMIAFLKRHYNVVAVEDVLAARRGTGRLPPHALLVTFDDGWADNVDHALPILRRANVPALIFIVADAVGTRRPFFQEELIAAWQSGRLSAAVLQALIDAVGPVGARIAGNGLPRVRALVAALEGLPAAERERILAPHSARLDDGLRHMVTIEDIKILREGGVAIGLHGKTHTPMTNADDLDAELGAAKENLAGVVGAQPSELVTLSFPHGRWTQATAARARRHGYELMFTSTPALNALVPALEDVVARVSIEVEAMQDRTGRFRPERLALHLFRRPIARSVERPD